jgi:uncharacterized membrane-anchored protein
MAISVTGAWSEDIRVLLLLWWLVISLEQSPQAVLFSKFNHFAKNHEIVSSDLSVLRWVNLRLLE